jgi:hypothetical protein
LYPLVKDDYLFELEVRAILKLEVQQVCLNDLSFVRIGSR